MRGREQEIRAVAGELNGLLDELRDTVGQLHAILTDPPRDDGHTTAGTEVPAP